MSVTKMFSRLAAERDQQIEAGERGRAGARRDELDLADILADQFQAVETAAPTMIAVPC